MNRDRKFMLDLRNGPPCPLATSFYVMPDPVCARGGACFNMSSAKVQDAMFTPDHCAMLPPPSSQQTEHLEGRLGIEVFLNP